MANLSDLMQQVAYLEAGGKPEGQRTLDKINQTFSGINQLGGTIDKIVADSIARKRAALESKKIEQGMAPVSNYGIGETPLQTKTKLEEAFTRKVEETPEERISRLGSEIETRTKEAQRGQIPYKEQQTLSLQDKKKKALESMSPIQQAAAFKLVDDYEKAAGEFPKVVSAYNRMRSSAENPSAAGDLALIFNYMKMLDPGSTVREGEFATAQNSGGVGDIIRARYNKILSGERLSDTIRLDFLNRSKSLYDSALKQQNIVDRQFTERAGRFGVPADLVIRDMSAYPVEENKVVNQGSIDIGTIPAKAPAKLPPLTKNDEKDPLGLFK